MTDLSGISGQADSQSMGPTAPADNPTIMSNLVKGSARQTRQPQLSTSHVMAALHYFDATDKMLEKFSNDPDLGTKTIRSKVIEGLAGLMGGKILSITQAMNGLKEFPSDPQMQKMWVMKMLRMNAMAREKVITDFRAQGPVQQDPQLAQAEQQWSPDSHDQHMQGLMQQYG